MKTCLLFLVLLIPLTAFTQEIDAIEEYDEFELDEFELFIIDEPEQKLIIDDPVKVQIVEKIEYKVGDTGPAGGIIFYDKGSFSGGWQYLEAAPVELEFKASWGLSRIDVRTRTVIGSGKENTRLISVHLNQHKEEGMAAEICNEIDFDGYNDWFIPSRDELDILYRNLKLKNTGNFSDDKYLSSSQSGRVNVWTQNFGNGRQDDFTKNGEYSVRVIRSF